MMFGPLEMHGPYIKIPYTAGYGRRDGEGQLRCAWCLYARADTAIGHGRMRNHLRSKHAQPDWEKDPYIALICNTQPKESTVTSTDQNTRNALAKIKEAEASIADAKKILEATSKIIPEPEYDGAVITFTLTLGLNRSTASRPAGKDYEYAALRANGRWFTTGSSCPARGYDWDDLVAFLVDARKIVSYPVTMTPEVAGF